MSRWYGKIGYAITEETEPGIWESKIIERSYYGDIISDRRNRQTSDKVNDDINLSTIISIVADPYVYQNCSYMAYAEIMGNKWNIISVEPQYPRLILTTGGVYNGEQARIADPT